MPVLINFKICDNSRDCSGITACPFKAFYWDAEGRTIAVNASKCTSCGKCEPACPVGAIRVSRTPEEYADIKKEIEKDPRKVSDLFVDRYGAVPVHPAFQITESKFSIQILESAKLACVEVFNHDSIQCLLHSVPIRDLFKDVDIKYRKMEAKRKSFLKKYKVTKLPALLFFKDGKVAGRIEGYAGIRKKLWLERQVKRIVTRYG